MATRKYMQEWGTLFSPLTDGEGNAIEHKKLTIEEAMLYTNMMISDFASQQVLISQDIQARLQRIEIWITQRDPTYTAIVRKALEEAKNGIS